MTTIALLGLAALACLAVAGLAWRSCAGGGRVHRELLARLSPVAEALQAGRAPEAHELRRLAAAPETRKVLFDTLDRHGRLELFPEQHRSWEAMAEADLAFWLCHPNELGLPPDELELTARLPAPSARAGEPLEYFVFRFRMRPPHWAAGDGWTAAVAGPYRTSDAPAPRGCGTFSRFEAYASRSPEEHVRVTHEQVLGRSRR